MKEDLPWSGMFINDFLLKKYIEDLTKFILYVRKSIFQKRETLLFLSRFSIFISELVFFNALCFLTFIVTLLYFSKFVNSVLAS